VERPLSRFEVPSRAGRFVAYGLLGWCAEVLFSGLHDFARIDEPAWPGCAGVEGVIVGSAYAARVRQGQHILCVGNIIG